MEGDGHYARSFSQPLLLGKNGVEERQSIGKLSAFEQQALEGMLDTLKKISRSAKTSSTSNLALTEEPEPQFRLFITSLFAPMRLLPANLLKSPRFKPPAMRTA